MGEAGQVPSDGTEVRLGLPRDATTQQAGRLLDTVRALVDDVHAIAPADRA